VKLLGVFRFELRYQARRVWPWLSFVVLVAFAFLFSREGGIAEAAYEDIKINSPFIVTGVTLFTSLVWLLLAAPVAGEAGARDVATGIHPIAYTLPVTKAEYLWGRFLAALLLNALIVLGVQVGNLLAAYLPGMHAGAVGPFRPATYLTAYAFISLPNAFFVVTIQFALATLSGRTMASYLGSVLAFFLAWIVGSLILWKQPGLGKLVDPIGVTIFFREMTTLWTTIEKNSRLVGLEGTWLWNRLLWFATSFAALAFTFLRFRFSHRIDDSWWRRRRRRSSAQPPTNGGDGVTANPPVSVTVVEREFGFPVELRQTLAVAWTSFRTIAKSWTGLALLIGLPLLTVAVVIDQMSAIGAPLVPTTARVIAELTGPLSAEMSRWVIIPLILVFFAGELVWRERDAGLGEITDAMPGSEWVPLLGKLLGLGCVLALLMSLLMAAGMIAQSIIGYHNYEIGLYLKILFGLQLPDYLLFTVLALVVHVVVDQKYVGHLVAIMAYVFILIVATMLGIEHNLLVYGASPGWSYTEMRGFGPFLGPWAWFKVYWAAWAILLAVAARLLWVRGRESGPRIRLELARRRFTRVTRWIAGAAATLVVMVGGFVFYNTNILNKYRTPSATKEQRGEYERRYGRYAKIPQPQITGTRLRVEIYPRRRVAEVRGSHRLVNSTARSIDSIHVATATTGVETRSMTFDRTASLALDDPILGHRIYVLAKSLAPGDTLRLDFEVRFERRGFGNRGIDPSVTATGSSFEGAAWLPLVGYQQARELIAVADRRKYGLEPRPVIASLYEAEGREPTARGGGIAFEAVLGTDVGQVAVAPGALQRTWTDGGRNYFHYATDAPIGDEWSFFSANYAVREGMWSDTSSHSGQSVAIRIFHDPRHTAHLDRMMRSMQASLEYYSKEFGPYPYHHLSVVEHPGAPATGMHASASMISYGEGVPYWIPKDEHRFDFPYAVMAHEMAHQWTLPYAFAEGAPFLSEGLAWYSAMQLVKESRGNEQLQQLLSFMRLPYPHAPIRRGEPLLRALDPYMSYRKGPFAMFELSEYVGAERVNGALRRQIAKHDSAGARLATTLDLYRELQTVVPDSLRHLLHDLFEINAFWQLDAEKVTAVDAGAGTWRVTLHVRARKMVYDSAGVEAELPMDEWVPVGVFGAAEQGRQELSAPLYFQMHRIHSGTQTITVTVPRKPVLAGIDPYHVLDWEEKESDNNIEQVKLESVRPAVPDH
jgi:ABC-type transport system involved in multi-copper enzyme maturation permease subunit